MAVQNFLCFDGVELSNCRTLAYAKAGYSAGGISWSDCVCCASDFYKVDNDGVVYGTPTSDNMPWVSPTEPDSGDWAGLLITNIEGLDVVGSQRSITDRIGDGGQFGRQRRPVKSVVVTAISLGRTCTAAWWGVRWLNEVLREPSCGAGCGGVDLGYYIDCPDMIGSCALPNVATPIQTAVVPYHRTLHRVALTDGVNVTDRLSLTRCCARGACTLPVVEFTLTAGDPHAYADPTTILTGQSLFGCSGTGACPQWTVTADGDTPAERCPEDPSCAGDTACGTVPSPPDPPLLTDPCVCEPLTFSTTCFTLPTGNFSDLGQTVPVVTIKAGSSSLRGLTLRFIPSDGSQPNPCDTCFEINLPFLQAGATWSFDAELRESTILCAGQTDTAVVTGMDGGPLDWPVFECVPTNYVMCVSVDCLTPVTGTTVQVELVHRHG